MANVQVTMRITTGSFGDTDVARVSTDEVVVEVPQGVALEALSSRDMATLADRMNAAVREAMRKMDAQMTQRADAADERERERKRQEREDSDREALGG